ITFESEDPTFSGIMRMIWTFQSEENGTLVTVRAENVPEGIRPEDHEAGLNSSLENLAAFVGAERYTLGITSASTRTWPLIAGIRYFHLCSISSFFITLPASNGQAG